MIPKVYTGVKSRMIKENIDAKRQWRCKSFVSEIVHVPACYRIFESSNSISLLYMLPIFNCYSQ